MPTRNPATPRLRRRPAATRRGAAAKPPGRAAGRTPGRPPLAGADHRTRLIQAALSCYVKQGIRATTIRDIARAAGVTPALVHYYFGDAARLLEQVIEERLTPVFQAVRGPLAAVDPRDPWQLVQTFVTAVFDAIEAHPWWPALWVREVISEGGALREVLTRRVGPELAQVIGQRLKEAQAAGKLNRDLDPRLMVVTLVGLTLFPAAGAPVWRGIFDAKDVTLRDLRAHALALLARGLEAKS